MPREYVQTSGTGAVATVPDLVVLRLRFVHAAPEVAGALEGCARIVREALAALDMSAGADHARRTGRIDVMEHWDAERQRPHGFEAAQSLDVRLAETSLVGAVIGSVSAATGSAFRMDGLTWGLSDTAAARTDARDLAFRDALGRAEQLAGLGGRTLGALLRVVEADPHPAGGVVLRAMKTEAADAMPAEAGDGTVEVTVTGRWLLVD